LAARYVTALEETAAQEGRDLLGAFPLTRKIAQNLGEFLDQAQSRGWGKVLAEKGLEKMARQPEKEPILLATAVFPGEDGSLEAAVARPVLAQVLGECLSDPAPMGPGAAADGVRRFLAAALYLRLVLDLGESLEAASRDAPRLRQGLETLRRWLEQVAVRVTIPPRPPAFQWQGLAGWVWVTQVLESLLAGIREQGSGIGG
jgi:hypothetical protein